MFSFIRFRRDQFLHGFDSCIGPPGLSNQNLTFFVYRKDASGCALRRLFEANGSDQRGARVA